MKSILSILSSIIPLGGDRHCYNDLFDYANDDGNCEVNVSSARELARQQELANAVQYSIRQKFVDRQETDVSALD